MSKLKTNVEVKVYLSNGGMCKVAEAIVPNRGKPLQFISISDISSGSYKRKSEVIEWESKAMLAGRQVFGYDPVYADLFQKVLTLASMTPEEKAAGFAIYNRGVDI